MNCSGQFEHEDTGDPIARSGMSRERRGLGVVSAFSPDINTVGILGMFRPDGGTPTVGNSPGSRNATTFN
jgi:hypothetical protein